MAAQEDKERESELSSDSFSQVNAALIDRGCLTKPLDLSGTNSTTKKVLAQLFITLLDQRQDDANFREQLSSKVKVAESSLERTKRFWSEEQNKSADLARRLETSKARVGTITKELTDCQSNLKRTKEELQKSKRDLLTVKQQAHQQRQANERQLERLRSKFSDESIKLLRSKVPEIHFATSSRGGSLNASTSHRQPEAGPSRLERKQIDELEKKRRDLVESNTALRKYATESLNLIREANESLERMTTAREGVDEKSAALASSSSSNSSVSTIRQSNRSSIYYQQDLFPTAFPLPTDYTTNATRDKKQHPAAQALLQMSDRLRDVKGRLNESIIGEGSSSKSRPMKTSLNEESSSKGRDDILLDKALQRIQDLEVIVERSKRDSDLMQSRREDREERIKQAAEVEKQRQRYLSLCKELEKQEEALRIEKEALQREREGILETEMSLSVQAEDSNISLAGSDATIPATKRDREEGKENEELPASKKGRVEGTKVSTPRENTMRFVTMRKQRLRLQ